MRGTSNRNAWIWVAIAAFALATAGSAGAGFQSARAYAQPVIAQLIASANQSASARAETLYPSSRPLSSRVSTRQSSSLVSSLALGALSPAFPILFVGLLLPLTLVSPAYAHSSLRVPSAPQINSAFQRPPPFPLG